MPRLVSVNAGLPRDVGGRGGGGTPSTPASGSSRWRGASALDGSTSTATAKAIVAAMAESSERSSFIKSIPIATGRGGWAAATSPPGQFGENFTVEGLADDAVCIGDRYRIGSALFEVTQPRVTC